MMIGLTHALPEIATESAREVWDSSRLRQLFADLDDSVETVLDAGRSSVGTELASVLGAARVVKRTEPMIAVGSCDTYAGAGVFGAGRSERFDVALLVDSLHEIYRDRGRAMRRRGRIDRRAGVEGVRAVLETVSRSLAPRGVMAFTADLLCEEAVPVVVRARSHAALDVVRRLVSEFTPCELDVRFDEGLVFEVNSRDLCVLLPAYEVLRNGDEEAWAVEREQVRPFMTASEARRLMSHLGLAARSIQAPLDLGAAAERDFDLLAGLPALPSRRLAITGSR